MDKRRPPLRVITGGRKTQEPRASRRSASHYTEQITCWRCEIDIGLATSMAMRVMMAPRRTPAGRLVGGTEAWVCPYCLTRGTMTELSIS